jgi:hypothetical protein
MDLKVFEKHELPLVLGALSEVALANERFTPAEADLIEGVARLHGQRVVAARLLPVAPEHLADVLVDPHRRKRAVQLAIIMSLVEGEPDARAAAAVERLAALLDVPESGVTVLNHVAHGHATLARFDVVRRMSRFVDQSGGPGLFRLALPTLLGFNEDQAVARRYWALGRLPRPTLGRALYDHFRQHGFALPGERHGMPEAMLYHDVGHLLSGYGVDPHGEIQQAAFQAGFARQDGFLFLLFGILQFHVGLRLTPIAKPEHGYFDVKKVLRAFERGAACNVDLSNRFDFFAHATLPLTDLRTRFDISAA